MQILKKSMDLEAMDICHTHPLYHTHIYTLNFGPLFNNSSTEQLYPSPSNLETTTKGKQNNFNPFHCFTDSSIS